MFPVGAQMTSYRCRCHHVASMLIRRHFYFMYPLGSEVQIMRGFEVNSEIQSTLVISKSKGLSETPRDIRTSIYQICRIEEKIIRTTNIFK